MSEAPAAARPLRRLRVIVGLALLTLTAGLTAGQVLAHSGLGAASPAPGVTVGGTITDIQLRYASAVSDPDGSVIGPDRVELGTEFLQDSVLAVTIRLDGPIQTPGEYEVRHISTSVDDGDRVEASFRFEYDPAAPPPQLEIIEADGTSIVVWLVLGAGVVVTGVLAWRLAQSMRRVRSSSSVG